MNLEENETKTESISLGQTLANARTEQSLSFDDIAARLKLNHSQITKLENDEYQTLGPETFVRGYIKSYSSLLGLDSESVLALYETPDVPEQKRNMKSFSRRTEKEANDNRLMVVSYLMLIVFVGLSAFWWWQTASKKDSSEEISGLSEAIATQSSSVTPTSEASPTKAIEPMVTEQQTVASQKNELSESFNMEVAPTTESVNSDAQQVTEQQSSSVNPVADESFNVQIQGSESPVRSPESQNTLATPSMSQVVMYFEQDSWVEIFDATQERVAFGVKKAGYTMTVTGQAPFSVVLGKHQVVSIELDGQPIDISGLPRNRLAKFKLPLAE
ncbi:RodZ domain-containing protein [Pseudoalteromonas luteoviolacea]|uniref:Cytoskeleton protein RodZ-like C-terminal domain-containing protein n=1 Tax=Pseudoalteromonas luteoviolacea S4054 TaxID=1129367 RepID=A0A0F6A8W4_9GAMM|nr:RodZ family helix-turn-helix domain-containing protein [Pseudoalteromonas luteoviolacea]AOT07084.1 hypothetical protein S4054249_04000 [Pseudoalteromonas luteoviolacea]AOT12001.1 hypothetical protein S40542_04000 [Pseudoalteromonas luteoviolacea]AOT16914.1 hypothetical protein S4054_04000 [Pseudoalteromonas luteoviolacea]KKE82583.1 hypothetical protein N479_17385 [Pseudoalteromonas luteoviolacea S4054]KZN69983.1 hypothetical protein N481_21440 [Pseudoalteromonas luteoviolacea S4047-1]